MSSPAARLEATARHLGSFSGASSSSPSIQNVTLFGAGLMGAGIAQVAAQNGFKVMLCDVTQQALDNGHKIISSSLKRIAKQKFSDNEEGQKKYITGVLANLSSTTDPIIAVSKADLAIEAIVENLRIKQDLFSLLDRHAKETCLFATNTSSLSVTEIAATTSAKRKAQFGGLHFFNPVPQMKLVEVVRTGDTSAQTHDAMLDFSKRLRKHPVSCKDTPGFIVNRLITPYMRDALQMLERGDASAEDIDTAMKLGAGYPMGPLELTDLIGLDTAKHIADGWRERLEKKDDGSISLDLVKPSPLLDRLVSEGKLGLKTGEGIYKYKK